MGRRKSRSATRQAARCVSQTPASLRPHNLAACIAVAQVSAAGRIVLVIIRLHVQATGRGLVVLAHISGAVLLLIMRIGMCGTTWRCGSRQPGGADLRRSRCGCAERVADPCRVLSGKHLGEWRPCCAAADACVVVGTVGLLRAWVRRRGTSVVRPPSISVLSRTDARADG